MIEFAQAWLLGLLPIPWLIQRYARPTPPQGPAVAVPLLQITELPTVSGGQRSKRLRLVLLWLGWICLVTAAAQPFRFGEPISRSVSGRDLMLAVDISGSMSEADMTIDTNIASRIDVLKLVVGKFIDRRDGDRLGLILFGTNAYTFVPLTFDLDTLKTLLQDISTGLAGRHTAIGDAIGLAIKSMREQEAEHKVLILATDGSNTAGFEDPVKAAAAARQQGMTIYTIGIGSDEETLSRTYGINNVPPGTALNETVLQQIAVVTGGDYFRATDTASLERIYTALDQLEPVEHEYLSYRPRIVMYRYPLVAAIIFLAALGVYLLIDSRAGTGHD